MRGHAWTTWPRPPAGTGSAGHVTTSRCSHCGYPLGDIRTLQCGMRRGILFDLYNTLVPGGTDRERAAALGIHAIQVTELSNEDDPATPSTGDRIEDLAELLSRASRAPR